jgi:hypothetical protein
MGSAIGTSGTICTTGTVRRLRSNRSKKFKPFKSSGENSSKTGLSPNCLFGKWAGAVFLDRGAVLGVEFGSIAEIFVHQRRRVLDMFGSENMA